MAGGGEHIRVKAMVSLPSADRTTHAVSRLRPTAENPDGYDRLIGGRRSGMHNVRTVFSTMCRPKTPEPT